jgi:hypothetical protein
LVGGIGDGKSSVGGGRDVLGFVFVLEVEATVRVGLCIVVEGVVADFGEALIDLVRLDQDRLFVMV